MREVLEKLLASGRDDALLRFSLGNACLKQDDPETAAMHLQQALEHDAGYSAAWKLLGQAHAAAGRNYEAAAAWERGIVTAEQKGDVQAAKEMRVFLKRLRKHQD